MAPRFTVLGANGRIGSELVAHVRAAGHECATPARDDTVAGPAGHLVYAIGLTADFRGRPIDTAEAHVGRLIDVLADTEFDSFTYLSSTRVYRRAADATETGPLTVHPDDPDDLYELTKLTGESLVHARAGDRARILRLSNVVGGAAPSSDFLPSLVDDAVRDGRIVLRSAPSSTKDYVSIRDVVDLIPRIAIEGRQTVYNVASGRSTTHQEICDMIREATGCDVEVAPGGTEVRFPEISIDRVAGEFGFQPRPPFDDLPQLVANARDGAHA